MTEKEYKKLENQKWEILAQLQKADEEKQAIKIRQNEQKYVGKCYRIQRNYEFYANKSDILFIKVMSAINKSPWDVWVMAFALPTTVKFEHRLTMSGSGGRLKFDFCFEDEDIIWFEEYSISKFELKDSKSEKWEIIEEISPETYNRALIQLYDKISWMANTMPQRELTMAKIFGENYERKIEQLSIQQREEENEEVQEED